jgi:hypothetical protein
MPPNHESFEALFNIVSSFAEKCRILDEEHPTELNFFNEINIFEIEHSKILFRLLNYTKNKEHYLLASFLKKLKNDYPRFSFSEVYSKYNLELEKSNIDLLIETSDGKAIIIENKINNAIDQEKQIERYVEVCKKLKYKEENIYIIYLTRSGGLPSSGSFNIEQIKQFGDRFISISYSDFIHGWLTKFSMPEEAEQDQNLELNIKLYQEHLCYALNINTTEQKKNRKMIEELEKICLDPKAGNIEKLEKLDQIEAEILSFHHNLKELKSKIKHENFAERLKADFPAYKNHVVLSNVDSYYFVGYEAKINNDRFSILMECDPGGKLYFGFKKLVSEGFLNQNLKSDLQNIIEGDYREVGWWYDYRYVSNIENEYVEFKSFIEVCLKNKKIEIIKG